MRHPDAQTHGAQVAPGLLQALRALLELRGAAPQPRARSQLAAMLDAALAKLARSLTALLGEGPGRLCTLCMADGHVRFYALCVLKRVSTGHTQPG